MLIVGSGIGLYPRSLETHNLASWQPDLERLGEQTTGWDSKYVYRHSDPETPAKYKPAISPTRCFTCYGVQVTKVGEVASQAGKKALDYTNDTKDMVVDYVLKGRSMFMLLKHLVDNKNGFWSHAYLEKGSPLRALVETTNECTGGNPSTLRLWGDNLREFSPYNLFKEGLMARVGLKTNFTIDELKLLGFQSE